MITLTQAILVALLYWLCQNAWFTNAGYRMYFPVAIGLFVGIIMGDPIQGTILGGILQTMNMAPSMVGSTVTMDLQMATFITVPMAIALGMDTESIIAFAVPFTVIGAFLQPLCRSLNEFGIKIADNAAARGDTRTFYFVAIFLQSIIQFPVYFGVMFCALYFGQTAMAAIISAIPETIMIAFIALSKFLPGIGFAMFLKSSGRKELFPFFFLGFYIMYFFSSSISLIGITIIAAIIAVLIVNSKSSETVQE